MTSQELVIYSTEFIPERKGHAASITVNRPEELNALSPDLISDFGAAIDQVEQDHSIRILFVTGSGRAFSAGGDLKRHLSLQRDPVNLTKLVADFHSTFGRLRRLRIPTVALVNGITAAGGLELLLNCDMAFAASSARIGDCHHNFGQMGGGGILTLLPRFVGIQRAAELVFSGRFLTATEALEWGLVNRVIPDNQLMAEGIAFAQEVASKSPLSVANAKFVMTTVWSEAFSVGSGLRLELDRNVEYCTTSYDAPEGLKAFREKRVPNFEGR
jgi:enoyl-CoA hydratase/carnithine racemase